MLQYLLRSALAHRLRNVLLILGLLAVSSGLSTYVAANQNARVRANASINEHWRGAYDILIRAPDAIQPTEQQHGVVEGNYLSVGRSGISVQQWQQISALPGVEVAAPVATIGELRGIIGTVDLSIPPQQTTSLLRVNVAISSTNGYRTTSVADFHQYFVIRPPLTDTNGLKQFPVIVMTSVDAEPDKALGTPRAGGRARGTSDGGVKTTVKQLPVVWTLVAGIDPQAEAKLSGLDQAITGGQYLANNDGAGLDIGPLPAYSDRNGNIIPIIRIDDPYISLPTTIKADRLKALDAQTLQQVIAKGDTYIQSSANYGKNAQTQKDYLDSLNRPVDKILVNQQFDLGSLIRPMIPKALQISLYDNESAIQTKLEGFFTAKGTEETYLPGAIGYNPANPPFSTGNQITLAARPVISAQTIISLTGETAFRSLPQQPTAGGGDFSFADVGQYSLSKLPAAIRNPDPLTYVPLGIYQPPLVTLVRDADGKLLPGGPVPLHPTLNPAGFIPGPPLALTNIAAARFFRGDNCIDAIRVRVAGIDRYTPANVKKVEAVAAAIIKTTGLHVDVVAGSSPQKVLVYIPGSADGSVAPLGYVEEQWTTLGAAAAIESGIDRASLLMLGSMGLAGLLYLGSQALLSTLARRRELALLLAVGWRRRHVAGLVLGEAAIFGALGGVCAVALAVLLAHGLGLSAPLDQAGAVGGLVLALYLLAALGPALWIVRRPVAELLQRGEVTVPGAAPLRARRSERLLGGLGRRGLAAFAFRNLARRRVRAGLAAGGIAIATALLMLLSAALVALQGTLRVTLLGNFVGLQVQPYHYIMVGSALIISLLTVADHLAVGVLERQHELALLQAIGWRAGAVRLSLLLEGLWLGLLGGAAGAVVAVVIALASHSEAILSAWWVIPAVLVGMLGLCSLSAVYAILLTPGQTLIRVMQQPR